MCKLFFKISFLLILFFFAPKLAEAQCTLGFTSNQSSFGTNCTGLETDIDLAGTPIKQYIWDFGDGYFGAGVTSQTVHQYALPGTYEVIIKVIDVLENTCIDTLSLVVPDAGSCEAGYTAYANPYFWNQFTIRGLITDNAGPYSYDWDTGDITQTFIHTLQADSEDICVIIDNSGSCADGYCDSVQLFVPIYDIEEFYQVSPTAGCNGVLAVSDSLFTDACSGVLVVDPVGSVDFASAWVSGDTLFFNTCNDVNAVGVVDPSDCHGQYLCSSTSNAVLSIEPEEEKVDFTIYPNPSTGDVKIKVLNTQYTESISINVYNAIGEKLETYDFQNLEDGQFSVDGNSGIYFIEIKSDNNFQIEQLIKL